MTYGTAPEPDMPSRRIVAQRIRNRVIEYLELASSFEEQRECERNAPIAHIPYEVIEQWVDWVRMDPKQDPDLSDVYDRDEAEALGRFHTVWEAAVRAVPDNYPTLSEVQGLAEWKRLRDAAMLALAVFMRRGTMPEDHEVSN